MSMFVAGATGYTGREVVFEARRRRLDCVAHVRPDSARGDDWVARFAAAGATVDRTPWDRRAFAATFAHTRPSALFVLLGTTQRRARDARRHGVDAGYESVDYGLSVLLLGACADAGVRPRVVYLSALGASATANEYLAVRHRVESELKASGLPYTIVRPSFISGPDRDEARPAERFGSIAVDGLVGLAGLVGARRLGARYASITSQALARNLVDLALDPAAENRVVESGELAR